MTFSYEKNKVVLKNNYIFSNQIPQVDNYEFSFKAKSNDDEVQIWSGFGFENRDNRYALGLRGENSNDLYLCKYQDGGKSNILSIEKLDFEVKKDTVRPHYQKYYTPYTKILVEKTYTEEIARFKYCF